MKKSLIPRLLLSPSLLLGCYDFGKSYDACLDMPRPAYCSANSPLGGATGASANSSGGGIMGTGATATGGLATGGVGTGGAGTGGATVAEIQRLRLSEACPSLDAVELQNPGPGDIVLDGLNLSVTSGGPDYSSPCLLGSGTLGGGEFMVVAAGTGTCAGISVRCVENCPLTFNASTANAVIYSGGETTPIAGFDDSGGAIPSVGSCWIIPSGGGGVTTSSASIGSANP
jgi:hypothetical protein